jgi:hypothetical protein
MVGVYKLTVLKQLNNVVFTGQKRGLGLVPHDNSNAPKGQKPVQNGLLKKHRAQTSRVGSRALNRNKQ